MTRHHFYTTGLVILLLAIGANTWLTLENIGRVEHDETHTRTVQVHGGPPAKCLLDAMKAVAPLLERVPSVARPLGEYVRIQSHRYPGVSCPDGER